MTGLIQSDLMSGCLLKTIDKTKSFAIALANIKGSKIKPSNLIDLAIACRILINQFGIKKLASALNVSEYQLRQIDKINELEPRIKSMIKQKKIGIESAYNIWRLPSEIRYATALETTDMKAHEVREFVKMLKNNPKLLPKNAKKQIYNSMRNKVYLITLQIPVELINIRTSFPPFIFFALSRTT